MDRWLKRAPGRAAGPSVDALPDELLLSVIQLVPEVTHQLLGSAVELESRGPVERVCRRWRQLALQLTSSLVVQLCELHDLDLNEEASRAAIERLLPHLSCRRITSLRITGCTYELAPEVPASLAHALYPELRSLHLGGASLLHCSSFLPLCRRLEELTLCTSSMMHEARQLLRVHLSGLRSPVQQLRLHLGVPDKQLLKTISQHMPLAALTLSAGAPAAVEWLPQLRHCTILVHTEAEVDALNAGLHVTAAQQLSRLCSLSICDDRLGPQRDARPPACSVLPHLPALRKLECEGSMVQSAWQCPHLTSLRLINVPSICGADTAAARCTGLRQLQLQACSFDDEPISSALCSMLGQLTSLAFLGSDSFRVPSQFSALSSLRQLAIEDGCIDLYDLDNIRWLRGLTALHLQDCELEGLPDGPYLSGLKSLDLSGSNPGLASPIPFSATAASGLEALRVNCNVAEAEEWWADVEWKLGCLQGLKLLCLDIGLECATDPQAVALAERIRSELPGCRLELNGYLVNHPEHTGLADFD